MKIHELATIISNESIAPNVLSMWFHAPNIAEKAVAGQFVEMFVNDGAHILPRPISICDTDIQNGNVRVVYQVVGKGTDLFAHMNKLDTFRVIGPLGNGFAPCNEPNPVVLGGGIGVPPMLFLCKQLLGQNPQCHIEVYIGFRSQSFLVADFVALGVTPHVATDDGSQGFHGNVVTLMAEQKTLGAPLFACGPKIMLASVAAFGKTNNIATYLSMEEKMACGVGACVGCVIKVKDKSNKQGWTYKKVCHDGPVFCGREVLWDE